MNKRIGLLLLMMSILWVVSGIGEAGVVGTPHDLTPQGPDPNVCSYCHMPHKAAGIKIWSTFGNESQLTNGPSTAVGNLCYTCHDGTVTSLGQSTVFNASLQQHRMRGFMDCHTCHSVHDNSNGKFMAVAKTGGTETTESATYCQTCHSGPTMHRDAVDLGDHLKGAEHPYKDSGNVLDDSCMSCHQPHGAAKYSTSSRPNPILKAANTDSAFCASCHPDRVQNTTGGNKHPANLTTAGTWGKVSCEACHAVHQPWAWQVVAILRDQNNHSQYCMICHQATGAVRGPDIGARSHPVQIPFTLTPADPAAAPAGIEIDDDGVNGPDYPWFNDNTLICESCHSAHLKGVDAPLLRKTQNGGELCKNCHTNK